MTGLLGAPLPAGYSAGELGTLLPVHNNPSSFDVPVAWTAQASIQLRAPSDYLRR